MTEARGALPPRPVRGRNRIQWSAYLYLAPALAFYVVFMIRPVVESAWISLFEWDGITPATSVGLANYVEVLTDAKFWTAVSHAMVFILFYAALPILLALVVVGVISRITVRGLAFFRAVLFVPYILSSVVVAIAWRWVYDLNGPANTFLRAIGLDSITCAWLGDFDTALPAVGLDRHLGDVLAGVRPFRQRHPEDLHRPVRGRPTGRRRPGPGVLRGHPARPAGRAAGGAGADDHRRPAQLRHRVEHHRRRPGTSTTVPSYYVYRDAFVTREVGRASTQSVLITVLILAMVGIVMAVMRDRSGAPRQRRRNRAPEQV